MYKPENSPLMIKNQKAYELRQTGLKWADIATKLNMDSAQQACGLAKNFSAREGLEWPVKLKVK